MKKKKKKSLDLNFFLKKKPWKLMERKLIKKNLYFFYFLLYSCTVALSYLPNTLPIVSVTDVWGRVISWSFTGTCRFKGTRRETPFVAQTVAGNAI